MTGILVWGTVIISAIVIGGLCAYLLKKTALALITAGALPPLICYIILSQYATSTSLWMIGVITVSIVVTPISLLTCAYLISKRTK